MDLMNSGYDKVPRKVELHKVIEILIKTLSARDNITFKHSWRVAEISTLIARNMNLCNELIKRVHIAAHLHDIGKIGVADNILNKPGKLTDEELKKIQEHSVIGYKILQKAPVFHSVSVIVLYHHERYDGLGYPEGLSGKDIPLPARIIAVADAFDAITSNRSYRQAKSYDYAFKEINDHVGEQFCPIVVRYFNDIFDLIPDIMKKVENEMNEDIIVDNWDINNKNIEINHEDLVHSRKVT